MSKFDDAVAKATTQLEDLGITPDAGLLTKVAKGLGPSIYNKDASLVSASDPEELARVKKNFLIKKLGLEDSDKLDKAIDDVMAKMKGKRQKMRIAVYYQLVKAMGCESAY